VFGWFKPTCPVDSRAKRWVEERLEWLADEFGLDVFTRRAIILPLEEYFPDPYTGSKESVRLLLNRVCGYMDADPDKIALSILDDRNQTWFVDGQGHGIPSAAGLYSEEDEGFRIHVAHSELHQPMSLVGTMAHELAHFRLMGEQRIDPEIFDNELLTDLTAIFHGFGIFLANTPRIWRSSITIWPDSGEPRSEYMTQPMTAYALAHSLWFRDCSKPDWMKALRPDARATFKQSLRYLFETRDSMFRPPQKSQPGS
jgi:hypothetical protein